MDIKSLSRIADHLIKDESARSKAYREAAHQMPKNFYAALASFLTSVLPTTEAKKKAGITVARKVLGNDVILKVDPQKHSTPTERERYGYPDNYLTAILMINGQYVRNSFGGIKFMSPGIMKQMLQETCTAEVNDYISVDRPEGRDISSDYRELSNSRIEKLDFKFPKNLQGLMKKSSNGIRQNQVKSGAGSNASFLSEKEYKFLEKKNPKSAEKFEKFGSIYLNKSKMPKVYDIPESASKRKSLNNRVLEQLKANDLELTAFCNEYNIGAHYLTFRGETYVLKSRNEIQHL